MSFEIIAHRGFWIDKHEQNSLIAFKRAFENGFGVESDFRGFNDELFISHDIANSSTLKANELFSLYAKFTPMPLAINVKSDGLQDLLKLNLIKFGIKNYFAFDMSNPDMMGFQRANLSFFTRQSDMEKECVLYGGAKGVWLDEFTRHWIDESVILSHLEQGKQICIVSPELHGRDFQSEWSEYKSIFKEIKAKSAQIFAKNFNDVSNLHTLNSWHIALCTDFPHLAAEFFSDFWRAK